MIKIKYLITSPEVRLSQPVQKVWCAAKNSGMKTGESYHPI